MLDDLLRQETGSVAPELTLTVLALDPGSRQVT